MKQNITLAIDKPLLKRAKALAAQRGTSISGLLGQELSTAGHCDQSRVATFLPPFHYPLFLPHLGGDVTRGMFDFGKRLAELANQGRIFGWHGRLRGSFGVGGAGRLQGVGGWNPSRFPSLIYSLTQGNVCPAETLGPVVTGSPQSSRITRLDFPEILGEGHFPMGHELHMGLL